MSVENSKEMQHSSLGEPPTNMLDVGYPIFSAESDNKVVERKIITGRHLAH